MKKVVSTFCLIFVLLNNTYSQQNKLNPDLLSFPISPEASRLGTYGDIAVNLFYGRLEKNIELFNEKVGDFNLPIQLSYNYAGNRLEETPSIIGLGWQLNLGGVVSREVRGLPDEHPRGYNNAAVKEIVNNYINNNSLLDYNAKKLAEGYYDSEADKYSLSVNGIHFSFKIGLDGNPAFLSQHDYKLQIIRDPNNNQIIEGFILTDTSANKYFFDQKEINEPNTGYNSFFEEGFPNYTSSWQLSKIILNNQKEIIYNYDDDDFISYNFYANIEIRNTFPPTNDVYNQGSTSDIIKRKILKSINCSNFIINFNYIKLNNHEVYNKISINDMNNKTVDSYSFSYSGRRNLLDTITKNNIFFYGFEYVDSAYLPDFINSIFSYPNNQDGWGFENGANNTFPLFVSGTIYNANKNPNFQYTINGALKTIRYQTGGKTDVTYEQNSGAGTNDENDPNVSINLKFKSDFSPEAPSVKESVFTKTFDYPVIATLSHYIENVNFIDVSIKKDANGPIDIHEYYDIHDHSTTPYYVLAPHARNFSGIDAPLIATQLNEMSQHDSNCLSFNNCSINKDSGGKFKIPAGTYEFKFRTDYNRIQDVKAEISLNFYDPDVALYTQNYPTIAVGGIRVCKTIDYPLNGMPIIKNYDYLDSDGVSSAKPFKADLFYHKLEIEVCCASDVGEKFKYPFSIPTEPNLLIVSSKPHNLLLFNNSPVGYLTVKEFTVRDEIIKPEKFFCNNCGGNFGGNWDNTAVYSYLGNTKYGVKKFIYPQGFTQIQFFAPKIKETKYPFIPMGTDLSIGVEESKIIYSNNTITTDNKKLTEDTSLYFDTDNTNYQPTSILSNPNYPKSLKVVYKVKRIDNSQITFPYTVNDFFYFKEYKEFDVERFIYNKKSIYYNDDTTLEKNILIEYDSHFKQNKITTLFDSNNIVTTELFYPYDFIDNVYQEMVTKNFISPIVKVINKKNGEITDSYKYDFNSISDNLFKPISFSKSKNNNALEKRNVYGYDSNGNIDNIGVVIKDSTIPREVIKGSNTKVIWGYRESQIIAKIENAGNVSIPQATINNLQVLSDADNDNCLTPSCKEQLLRKALNDLRNSLPSDAFVTTYTYNPLIGLTSITDPKGQTIYYEYDEFNRLKHVKDDQGNILSENQYHYKN